MAEQQAQSEEGRSLYRNQGDPDQWSPSLISPRRLKEEERHRTIRHLTFEEFNTVVIQIESVLNFRTMTPSHF